MSTSNHNSDSPSSALVPAPRRRALRRALPPPDQLQPLVPHILQEGDDAGAFLNLSARAALLSGQSADFAGFLSDVLASQAWEFSRCETMRSAALHLQVEDDRESVDAAFQQIDDPTRQYLSYAKASAKPAWRELGRESERFFRRIRQSQDSIRKAISQRVR